MRATVEITISFVSSAGVIPRTAGLVPHQQSDISATPADVARPDRRTDRTRTERSPYQPLGNLTVSDSGGVDATGRRPESAVKSVVPGIPVEAAYSIKESQDVGAG